MFVVNYTSFRGWATSVHWEYVCHDGGAIGPGNRGTALSIAAGSRSPGRTSGVVYRTTSLRSAHDASLSLKK